MRHVCVFCEKWGSGGIEAFLINLLSNIDKTLFSVEIITAKLESSAFLPKLENMGYHLEVLPSGIFSSHMRFFSLYNCLDGRGFDVIHLNLYQGLSIGYAKAARLAGIPTRIVHSHNSELRPSSTYHLKLLLHSIAKRYYAREATARLACSEKAAKFMFTNNVLRSHNWVYLPNGIDLQRFSYNSAGRGKKRQELNLKNELCIGCIGRLCSQKNQTFLLKVFRLVKKRQNAAKLVFVGEGEDLFKLKTDAQIYGLNDSVLFLGVSDQIPELLWSFDVLAFPTLFEGLGIVAVEAQAASLPVLCSEAVPYEVRFTDYVDFLSLDSAELWADRLISMGKMERRNSKEQIDHSVFEIKTVAKTVQDIWAGKK